MKLQLVGVTERKSALDVVDAFLKGEVLTALRKQLLGGADGEFGLTVFAGREERCRLTDGLPCGERICTPGFDSRGKRLVERHDPTAATGTCRHQRIAGADIDL